MKQRYAALAIVIATSSLVAATGSPVAVASAGGYYPGQPCKLDPTAEVDYNHHGFSCQKTASGAVLVKLG